MKELRFFTLNKDLKKFTPVEEAEFLEKLGVLKELESVIVSGEYKKMLQIDKPKRQIAANEVPTKDHELMPPPAKIAQLPSQKPTEDDEDNAIQNLLDDIRGSFERQFDDEFNDLTDTAASEGENVGYCWQG